MFGRRRPSAAGERKAPGVVPPFRRRPLFEALESRLLLSADFGQAALLATLQDGVDQIGAKIESFVADNPLLNQALPLLVRPDGTGPDANTIAAALKDLLYVPVDINGDDAIAGPNELLLQGLDANTSGKVEFDEAFGGGVIDRITQKLTDYINSAAAETTSDFVTFLDGLDTTAGPFSIQFSNVSNTSDINRIGFKFDLAISFGTTQPLDLGTGADALSVSLTADLGISASLTLDDFEFGVFSTGEAPTAEDVYVQAAGLKASVEGGAADLDASLNIGFIGASIQNGVVTIDASIDADFADPSSPASLGFSAAQINGATATGTLTAANVVSDFNLEQDAAFTLRINSGDAKEVRVAAGNYGNLAGLKSALQTAVNADFTGVTVGDNGERLTLTAPNGGDTIAFISKITLTDLDLADLGELLPAGVSPSANVDVNLPISVSAGIGGFAPSVTLAFSGNPFSGFGTPSTDSDGNSRFHFDVDFSGAAQSVIDDLLNFREFTVEGAIGMINQLADLLQQVGKSDLFGDPNTFKLPFTDTTLSEVLSFADLVKDALLYDDNDTPDNPADDVAKLLDADNNPTFTNVQGLAQRLIDLALGDSDLGGVNALYDHATESLTFTVDLSNAIAAGVDVPLDFSLDLSPLLNIESDTTVSLDASAGLKLKFGVYLGDAPSSTFLTDDTLLTDLRNPPNIRDTLAVTGGGVTTVYGRGAGDVKFKVKIDGGADVEINLLKTASGGNASNTGDNNTVADLVADINAAFAFADAPGGGKVGDKLQAVLATALDPQASDKRIVIKKKDSATVASFQVIVSANDAGLLTGLPSGTSTAAVPDGGGPLQVKGSRDVKAAVGILSSDAMLNVSVTIGGNTIAKTVTLAAADTTTNSNILDVAADLEAAIGDAFLGTAAEGKLEVTSIGDKLVIGEKKPESGGPVVTALSVTGTNASATNALKLGALTGNQADLVITTRNGSVINVALDGATDLGDVISKINTAPGNGGKVVASYFDGNSELGGVQATGLQLTDTTVGGTLFKVEPTNASGAVFGLGILASDKKSEDDTPDGKIEGGAIGGIDFLDRFFVDEAEVEAKVSVTAPSIEASAQFGFVGLEITGEGALGAKVVAGLKDDGTADVNNDDRLSLAELIDGLGEDVLSVVQLPTLSLDPAVVVEDLGGIGVDKAGLRLEAHVTPAISLLTGGTPTLTVIVNSLGDPFGLTPDPNDSLPDIDVNFDDGGIANFGDFQEIGFDDILKGLQALVEFLGTFDQFEFLDEKLPVIDQSINDLLSFADQIAGVIEDAEANPAGTVQQLEDRLKNALGIPSTSDVIDLSVVDGILKVALNLHTGFSKSLGINIDIADFVPPELADFATLAGGANLNATGSLDLKFAFGVELDNPLNVYLFDDSELTGHLAVSGEDLTFTAALLGIGVESNGGEASLGGDFTAEFTDFGPTGRKLIQDIDFASDFAFDINPGDIDIHLPLSLTIGSIDLGAIDITGDLFDPDSLNVELPDDIFSKLNPQNLSAIDNLLLMVDGIDQFLETLQDILDGEVFGAPLPLVGDQLASAANFIADFRHDFIEPLRQGIEQSTDPNQNFVSQKLFQLLGPAGLNILKDLNDDGNITAGDIVLTTNADEPGVPVRDVFYQWNVNLGGLLLNVGKAIGFDIGLPGLGLQTDGSIDLDLAWDLDFGFGVNLRDGFYLDVSDNSELQVDLDVTIPGAEITGRLGFLQIRASDKGDTHLGATFAIDVTGGGSDGHMGLAELGSIGLDVKVGAEAIVDLELALELNSELVPGASTIFPSLSADFYLEWGVGDRGAGDLVPLLELGDSISHSLKLVEFRNVGLELGEFLSDVLDPIVSKVQEFTKPIQPVIDIVTAPIPVISDVAGQPITLLDIAGAFGTVDARLIKALKTVADVITLLNSLDTSQELKIVFGSFTIYDAESSNPDLKLNLSDKNTAKKLSNPDTASGGFGKITNPGFSLDGILGGSNSSKPSSQAAKKLTSGSAAQLIDFPIIKDPSQAFGLLLGQPATLITIDPPPLFFEFSYKQVFPLPPFPIVQLFIKGEASINIDFSFGYDTLGITEFIDSGGRNPELLFDGFYISDTASPTGSGPDVPELSFGVFISAGAQVGFGPIEVGVEGGIGANIFFDLHDPNKDGKVRIKELIQNVEDQIRFGEPALAPIAIFDVSGEIFVRLFAFVKVDLFFFSIDEEFDIVPKTTLATFDLPIERFPILAQELPGGVLQINMGDFAADRLEGNTTDGDEHFVISGDGSQIKIKAPGLTSNPAFERVYKPKSGAYTRIIVQAGAGNDIIDLTGITDANIKYEIEGGEGNDQIMLAATAGLATVRGGGGDDKITTGAGDDLIFGDDGNDEIDAGNGKNVVFGDTARVKDGIATARVGGTGADKITGGSGVDVLVGGGGDDQIHGGGSADWIVGDGAVITLSGTADGHFDAGDIVDQDRSSSGGADKLYGEDGDDLMFAGAGDDLMEGGGGADRMEGGRGKDDIKGQAGADLIYGGLQDDTISGGDDADAIWGEDGRDDIHGDGGMDEIHGGLGNDTIHGDADKDFIFGDSDPDKIWGGDGDDEIDGGAGNNEIYGEAGKDTIVAFLGADRIFGGLGDDSINGGLGKNWIEGNEGNDTIVTPGGDSTIFGNDGDDTITAGGGKDIIQGQAGADIIDAGGGDDTVDGGLDGDTIHGGTGADVIFGGEGDDFIYGNFDAVSPAADGANEIHGGDGFDHIWGGNGVDTIFGDDDDDVVFGLGGDDTISGGKDDDELHGGLGDDLLIGGEGDDHINGDAGSDIAWGGFADFAKAAFDLTNPALFENPPGWDLNEPFFPTGFTVPRIMPKVVAGQSRPGTLIGISGDGIDTIDGGAGVDFIFGGTDSDDLRGGDDSDYIDGGASADLVFGNAGDDVIRGGTGSDTLRGGSGIDQIYGDEDADFLYGDAGRTAFDASGAFSGGIGGDSSAIIGQQAGTRMYGGSGEDFLYAFAAKGVNDIGVEAERLLVGDEMHGGADNDFLYGNQRRDTMFGDAGKDNLYGDWLSGPLYADSNVADIVGGADHLYGGTGQDKLLGGGADDEIWGGQDTDWLEGQNGHDTLYGGSDVDLLILDVKPFYNVVGDVIDGHFANNIPNDTPDDFATDILLIEATNLYDTVRLGETAAGVLHVDYKSYNVVTDTVVDDREILAPWRAPDGTPLVEQIRVSGLGGNDTIEFLQQDEASRGVYKVDLSKLIARSNDFVSGFDGGPGNDVLIGAEGRDRLDGGVGDDVLYGYGGDDRLWGDIGNGNTSDFDVLFGGQGADDLVGGQGRNQLFAWSEDPDPTVSQLHFFAGQTGTGTVSTPAVLTGRDPAPADGRLRADMYFALSVGGAAPVQVFLSQAATEDNDSLADLVSDLNGAIAGTELAGQVVAGSTGGKMTLSTTSNNLSLALELRQFGIFVGSLHDDDGDLNRDGLLDSDLVSPPRPLEDTGLDRMLGFSQDDELYGGTGIGFLFGDGGEDRYFRADGTEFESLDGGVLGDQWKQYAKESGKAWYVGGSDVDDVITVDYVTEPGLLRDHHLVTRLTNNNGNFSFAAQVRLDFDPSNPLFAPTDVTLDVDAFKQSGVGQNAQNPNTEFVTEGANFVETAILDSALPGEADFDVILVDALGGNDQIYVGPTVQKTVWIDAGAGDDLVRISSGNALLVDGAEDGNRNDTIQFAAPIADGPLDGTTLVKGLTIDNPTDADWFRFTLASVPAGAKLKLTSASALDGLSIAVFEADGDPAAGFLPAVQLGQDGPETALSGNPPAVHRNETPATATALPAVQGLARARGLTIHDPTDKDYFSFELTVEGTEDDRISLLKANVGDQLRLAIVDEHDVLVRPDAEIAPLARAVSLDGLAAGKYYLRVTTLADAARYELAFKVGVTDPNTPEDDRQYLGTDVIDLSGKDTTSASLAGLTAGTEYLLRVSSPKQVPTSYELLFDFADGADPEIVSFSNRTDIVRRDVILGGTGNDVLQGGAGEDWIFGGDGNDVLTGGKDRQAEDLLFGNAGDDTFQLIPDEPPLLTGTDQAFKSTFKDRFDGGDGDDRVLFLGGDYDRLGRAVPDEVAIRWNRFLHQYDFAALQWDIANQQFVVAEQVLNATQVAPANGRLTAPANFELRLPGGNAVEVSVATPETNTGLSQLIVNLQDAIDTALEDAGLGDIDVVVESIDGKTLRLRVGGVGFELRTAESDTAVTELHFSPLTVGSPVYQINTISYQTASVEHTVIDTKAGDDVVRGLASFFFPNVASEWGFAPGDMEQRALLAELQIYGGEGNDRLFGGPYDDYIDGGTGADLIVGGGGDDEIHGGPGADLLAGDKILEPDRLEFNTRNGIPSRNDFINFAAGLPAVRAGTSVDGLNFSLGDEGDWYIVSAAEAARQFGDTANALLTSDMIEVVKVNVGESGIVEDPTKILRAFLFPAEDTDPGPGVALVPRERFSGVPEFYLLHVTNELEANAAQRNGALTFDGEVNAIASKFPDYVQVAASPSLKAADKLTIEAWVRPGPPGPDGTEGGIIVNKEGEYEIARFGGTLWWAFANSNPGWAWVNTGYALPEGEWTHVAVVYDRGLVQTYANGQLVHTYDGAGNIGDADTGHNELWIGGRQAFPTLQNWEGRIDEVRIWTTARTAEDIQGNFGRVLSGTEQGLAGYWRFEEAGDLVPELGGEQVMNLTANKNHGTLQNGLAYDDPSGGDEGDTGDEGDEGVLLAEPFGIGQYRIKFLPPLGETVHVPAEEATASYSSSQLLGSPAFIPLGDINGDGFNDAVVAIRDNVLTGSGERQSFARIAFGAPGGLDPSLVNPPLTLALPAPVLTGLANNKAEIKGVGDIDGDGFDDIAIAVTQVLPNQFLVPTVTEDQGVYILFGRADWRQDDTTADAGLFGEYFSFLPLEYFFFPASLDHIDFDTITPAHTRVDAQVNLAPTVGPGFAGFAELNDYFGARWTGQIRIATAGTYTFYIGSDDGSRLYIDNQLVVNHDGLHAYSEKAGAVTLATGFHDIRLEMFENAGAAAMTLSWDPPGSTPKQIVPSNVLFRDARDVLDLRTDRDLFLPYGDMETISVAGAGNVTPLYGRGLRVEYFDYTDTAALDRIPGFADGQLLRNQTTGETRLTLEGLPAHDSVDLEFLLAILGGWSGNAGPDRFNVTVDGVSVFANTFSNTGAAQSYVPPTGAQLVVGENRGFGPAVDSLYDLAREPSLKAIAHTASTLVVRFFGNGAGYNPGAAESWAIDNLRVRVNTPTGPELVFSTDFNGGAPGELSGTTTVESVQGFGPTHVRGYNNSVDDVLIEFGGAGSGFDGFGDLQTNFAARWSGQVFIATAGEYKFRSWSDDGSRLYIDDELVVDNDGLHALNFVDGTKTLAAGYHDLRWEYFNGPGGAAAALLWDVPGDGVDDFIVIDQSVLERTDESAATGRERADLLVRSGDDVELFPGRPRVDWLGDPTATFTYTGLAASGLRDVVALGDVNLDGIEDFGVARADDGDGDTFDELLLYAGANDRAGPKLAAIIKGHFGAFNLRAAGDVDGDGAADILISTDTGNRLIFGGGELSGGGGVPVTVSLTASNSVALPGLDFRTIGDFDGDGKGDLAAAAFEKTERLSEFAEFDRQVLHVYLGDAREHLTGAFEIPDLVLEPGRARFTTPSPTAQPQPLLFGPLGNFKGSDDVERTLLAFAGGGGDALRLYSGEALGPVTESLTAPAATLTPELFLFPLAPPKAPGFGPQPVPGINVSVQSEPEIRNAFALAGESNRESLANAVQLADFNGDRVADLLVYGDDATYVLLGAVELGSIAGIRDRADYIIDGEVGRPAERMGDVSGDGLTDLVFVRPSDDRNSTVLTLLLGGDADGIEIPRHVTRAWIDGLLPQQDQNRLRQVIDTNPANPVLLEPQLFESDGTLAVLNWDDDGFADILITAAGPFTSSGGATVGYVIDGESAWGAEDAVAVRTPIMRATLRPDPATQNSGALQQVATSLLGASDNPAPSDAQNRSRYDTIVAGDVNGDGLDDVLLVDSGFISFGSGGGGSGSADAFTGEFPNVGRAYLMLGKTTFDSAYRLGPVPPSGFGLSSGEAGFTLQDFAIGGSGAALGDLNGDGYDDFAVSRTREGRNAGSQDLTRDGAMFVFYGQASYTTGAAVVTPASAAITVRRDAVDNLQEGVLYIGTLQATAGDFNGDGKQDLLVGEPSRLTTVAGSSTLQILDQDDRGHAYVFFSMTERSGQVLLADADADIRGQFDFDHLGVLPAKPGIDIDGDGVDDLLIGAPNADLVIESLIGGAGKLYVAYGASRPPQLPPSDQIIDLTNTSVGGSGDFLKEEGGNRPTEFTLADIDGDGLDDFVLRAGETERWYRFTTLGDGKGGNFIRVTPGELDNFVAPTAPQSNTVTVGTPTPVGARVVARSTWDGAIGSMFVGDALSQTGRVTEWTMRAGGYTGNREITPLIFRQAADGRFEITGIGATRTIAGGAAGTFAFDLQSGSDATGAGYFFGWKDGSAFGDNGGVIAFDFGSDFNPITGGSISHPVSWLGDWQGLGQNVYVGKSAAPVWTDVRAYSVTATVSTGGILEFDLGRFLDRVGDPASIEVANLILDAPGAVAPIAAPTDVANLTPSGGLLYFTAKTGDTGVELWVTDGTSGGTRLVKDLNPDAADSLPINLTDVAGTLFFTANAKVGGTELWMTDGTADGTKMVATLNGVPARFTALPGDAALVATGAVPLSGKLALPFEFTLEVLKADGTRVGVNISLPKTGLHGTADNDDPVDLKDDIAGLLDAALVAAGLPGGAITVATTLDQTTLVFSAPDADTTGIVEVIVREAATIGFGAAQTTPLDVSLLATNAAPVDGKLADDLTFTMNVETVGGTTRTLTINLQAEATANNGSVANLAADLNAAMAPVLATFGFGTNGVTASAGAGPASGKLVLTAHERNIARITFTGAGALGITDTDESSRIVAITASDAAPATGQPVVNLPFEIEITRTNGTTALLSLTLTEAATADNGGAGDLAFDLQQALDAALTAAGFGAGDLVVGTDDDTGTKLTLTSAADAIRSFTVFGADALGFGTAEEAQQASVREGDRVFFTMATSALGTELWTSDGTESGTRAFDLRPGALSSGPAELIAVDGVLYFTALDPANPATRVVWRYDGTGSPVALPSAAFSSPSGLAAAGHALVFTALPAGGGADREVFLLDGTTFTKLSSVPWDPLESTCRHASLSIL